MGGRMSARFSLVYHALMIHEAGSPEGRHDK